MDKKAVRLFFSKKGRAVYISHLDLLRTMQRALKRAGIPVWYSEGFNPRIYLNFPLALSVGIDGEHEAMDFYITDEISFEKIVDDLNAVLPEGLHALSAAAPVYLNKEITSARYIVRADGITEEQLCALLSQPAIEVQKHSKKKGMVTVDIKPHVKVTDIIKTESGIIFTLDLPAGNELNLNPSLFTDKLNEGTDGEIVSITRTKIFCGENELR